MAADQSQAIAMIYAEALFELAEEQDQSGVIREELESIAQAIDANPDFAVFLESPAITRDQKAGGIIGIFENRVSGLMMDFLKVLAGKDRLNLIREIHHCFSELEDEKAGRVKGVLTTAIELTEQEHSRLNEQINRALRKTVSLRSKVDPAILGGMVLTIEDTVMDASLQGALKQMKNSLYREAAEKLPAGRDLLGE